jgi:glycosyltransferase involved in cell wall biosynthesis
MREAKVVVLPSRWDEAFGRILVESVFCGTLPVGSNKGAIPEVLNYESKYIFESRSDLTQKLARIFFMNDKEYSDEVSRIENNMEKFTVRNHVKYFSNLYENI